ALKKGSDPFFGLFRWGSFLEGGAFLHSQRMRLHREAKEKIMSAAIVAQPAPSPAVAKFLERPPRFLVGGEWVEPMSDAIVPVYDPSSGEQVAVSGDANAAAVYRAVNDARRAFGGGAWRELLPSQREALIWKLSDLIDRHADERAERESIDNGKTKLMASIVDIPGSRDYFRYMAGWATKIEGSTIDVSIGGRPGGAFHAYTRREPVGVVAQIIPWNFPLAMAAW